MMTYKRILVPVDGSSTSTKGLEEAARLASAKGCRVRLLHVIDQAIAFSTAETGAGTNLMLDVLRRSGKQALSTAEARARRKGIHPESALLESLSGRVADAIVQQAKRWRADLIVMGTHGRRGFDRLLLGSNAELVVRHSPVPVLLVPARRLRGSSRRSRR